MLSCFNEAAWFQICICKNSSLETFSILGKLVVPINRLMYSLKSLCVSSFCLLGRRSVLRKQVILTKLPLMSRQVRAYYWCLFVPCFAYTRRLPQPLVPQL